MLAAIDQVVVPVGRFATLCAAQDFDRHQDGCERVPELVGEHGQEFGLAAIRIAHGLLGGLALVMS
jgi:hypothetical protein